MKIFYICRTFSGLESSLLNKVWNPTGVPTIYKVLEYLDKSKHQLRLILIDYGIEKEHKTIFPLNRNFSLKLKNFGSKIFIIVNYIKSRNKILMKIEKIFSLIKIQFSIIYQFLKFKPDVIYVDRSNILIASILTRFFKANTLIRIMGIYPSMWEIPKKKGLSQKVISWCFKSKFKLAICTEDGTAGNLWMKKSLDSSVNTKILLNGVGKKKKIKNNYRKKINISFVGRLESIKGCEEFIRGISLLNENDKKKIIVNVIGTGSLEKKILMMISKLNLKHIINYQRRIPHNQMSKIFRVTDIYVSLNKLGNLSNSNLEFFSSGICSIIPEKNLRYKSDLEIEKYFSNDVIIKLPIKNIEKKLADKLSYLINNRKVINNYSKKIYDASKNLKTWKQRVDEEIKLIESIK